jgi:hypothetical protein
VHVVGGSLIDVILGLCHEIPNTNVKGNGITPEVSESGFDSGCGLGIGTKVLIEIIEGVATSDHGEKKEKGERGERGENGGGPREGVSRSGGVFIWRTGAPRVGADAADGTLCSDLPSSELWLLLSKLGVYVSSNSAYSWCSACIAGEGDSGDGAEIIGRDLLRIVDPRELSECEELVNPWRNLRYSLLALLADAELQLRIILDNWLVGLVRHSGLGEGDTRPESTWVLTVPVDEDEEGGCEKSTKRPG